MRFFESVLDLVGRTPLVRLNRIVSPDMATVYAKLEYLNPTGSVKDRIALNLVNRAEEAGLIAPGATLVESTSGNTGLGLAMVAAVRGYRCICTMPDKMSKEKIDMLKAYGAEVVITRTDLPHDHPESYVETAKRIARETPGAFYTDQYFNMANPEAHYLTTGPEIWEDTDGQIDCLVGGIGTGGTMSGAARYLKERAAAVGRSVRVVCPDPRGSIYHDLFYKGVEPKPSVYRVEGIGHDFMVGTLDFAVIDEIVEVSDRDSFHVTRRLAREEGIFSGGSTGTALWGALKAARELGPGRTVVVIIPDSGDRYLSKLYSDAWMQDMGFVGPEDRLGTVRDILKAKGGKVEFADAGETIGHVASRMSTLGFSQLPLRGTNDGDALRMVHELDILQGLVSGRCTENDPVSGVAEALEGQVALDDPLTAVQSVFDAHNVAVAVVEGKVVGIISKIDVVQFLAARRK